MVNNVIMCFYISVFGCVFFCLLAVVRVCICVVVVIVVVVVVLSFVFAASYAK